MRRRIVMILLILGCFLVQSTIWSIFPLTSFKPNLLLVLTVSFAFVHGKKSGIFIGFISGILIDLFYGTIIGFTALIYMYIGYAVGSLYKVFFDDDVRIPMIITAAADAAYSLIFYLIRFALGHRLDFPAYFRHIIMPEVISTVIFMLIFFRLFYFINKKLLEHETEEKESPWLLK